MNAAQEIRVTVLPRKLGQVLSGLTGGPLPAWYEMQEKAIWSDPTATEQAKRRKVLRGWLEALDCSRNSKEWRGLAKECAAAGTDAGSVVLRSMLLALRPIVIFNAATTKKSVTSVRDAASKLKKALEVVHASGLSPLALTSGRVLVPLTSTVAFVALETVPSLRGRDQADANVMAKWKRDRAQSVADQVGAMGAPAKLLMVWLDELRQGCDAMLKDRTQGPRGNEPARLAKALALCLENELHDSLGKRKWTLAATLASKASGQEIDAESLRITSKRN
jgi:hypothetical protein